MSKSSLPQAKYSLTANGHFVIENYNYAKPFSNFFPGIAGLWGVPMWAFYVNRGQCITSFGIESKDKAIMEFQPANKSYRYTALSGFRTFIKVKRGRKTVYWEPFQNHLEGTSFKKSQKMSIAAHDLTLEEKNDELGLTVKVNFFTIPEEPYSGLVRRVSVKNNNASSCDVSIVDGLPVIVPYGLGDWLNKHLSRTVEAWVKVRNLDNDAPYYQLNVEVDDSPEVRHIKEGNFFFSFNAKDNTLLKPIVEAASVFGQSSDFIAPQNFLDDNLSLDDQQTSNRSPSAMSSACLTIKGKSSEEIISVYGMTHSIDRLNRIVKQATNKKFIEEKAKRNQAIVDEIKNYATVKSSSEQFNMYAGHTFLDNILRGGLPVSLKTSDGHVGFNVYSRKHGDLERDYNFFTVAPTYYSQGNGNYRDVNQNRRNDVWFNGNIKDSHLVNFLNLSQADGYNPLVVKGTTFSVKSHDDLKKVVARCVASSDQTQVLEFFDNSFLPGNLLQFIEVQEIELTVDEKDFLGQVLEICRKEELAEHGEGFWSDHWTYNLDLIESYLALYPENLNDLLLERKPFTFYFNSHYVLPREQRYILTGRGVRQYASVKDGKTDIKPAEYGDQLRVKQGAGDVYYTNLVNKLLCLIACKVATLDPSGIGVEMEADKPNWYDALNGLPGLLGSSISETFEVKRHALFVREAFKKLGLEPSQKLSIYEELATFIDGLTNILSTEQNDLAYWNKANDVKENYRNRVRRGIEGEETELTVKDIRHFLELVIERTGAAEDKARNKQGFIPTYFYHDVSQYDVLDKSKKEEEPFVRPKAFARHDLPLFLEGYVHALRSETQKKKASDLYEKVRESDLYDKKLGMYKVNIDLSGESEEIGRTSVFPASWLENESIWLHMEYKFMLEVLRRGLYEEFYHDFKNVFVPFLKPAQYGRSVLENSSFIVSSAHEDQNLHGQGFVARLSGSTAEFMHIWLYMNVGQAPFALNAKGELTLQFEPALAGWLFTSKPTSLTFSGKKESLPKNSYAFNFLNGTFVVYHNPKRLDTFDSKAKIKKIELTYHDQSKPVVVNNSTINAPHAQNIRDGQVARVDIHY